MPDLVFNLIVRDDGSAVIERFGQTAKSVAKRTRTAASTMTRAFGRLRRGLRRVTGAVFSLKTAFIALAFGVVARVVGSLIGTFLDFERAMNKVAAITGATGQVFEALTAQAKELGRTTVFTATQAAEAQALFARAGFEAAEIFAAVPKTLNLAAAAQLDLASATDIVVGILRGLQIPFEDLTDANDVLVAAFTSSNVTLTDLGDSFRKIGPIAVLAGVEFRELTAILGVLGDAGIRGGEAGTGLRRVFTSLLKPTGEAKKALDRLGISSLDSSGKLRPLTDIFGDLSEASLGATDAITIFGVRGAAAAAAITTNIEKVRELNEALEDVGGTAERVATRQLAGLVGAVTLMKSAIESAKISIVEALKPAIIDIAQAVTNFAVNVTLAVNALTKFFEKSRAAGEEGSFLKGVLDAITPSAETLIAIFFGLRRAFLSLQFIFLKVKELFLTLAITVIPIIIRAVGDVIRFIGKLVFAMGTLLKEFPGLGEGARALGDEIRKMGNNAILTGQNIKLFGTETSLLALASRGASRAQLAFNIILGAAKTALADNKTAVDKTALAINNLDRDQRGAISTLAELVTSEGAFVDVLRRVVGALLGVNEAQEENIEVSAEAQEKAQATFGTFGEGFTAAQISVLEFTESAGAALDSFNAGFRDSTVETINQARTTTELVGSTIGTLAGVITQNLDKESKTRFRIEQGVAVASAVINTAQAATKALAVGPILGPILAGIIIALGVAQIATILSAKPGGGAGGLKRGGGAAAGGAAARGVQAAPEAAPPRGFSTVSISVAGFIGDEAQLAEEIARISREAIGDGLEFGVQASRR